VPIGRRFRICHHGAVHVGAWSVGNDVTVRHAVTIGVTGGAQNGERSATIGDGVELGPGATVVGTVTVGDGAYVGPNALVTADVPPGATVMGVPARVVRQG
jgi:serine O-acetyltransferase